VNNTELYNNYYTVLNYVVIYYELHNMQVPYDDGVKECYPCRLLSRRGSLECAKLASNIAGGYWTARPKNRLSKSFGRVGEWRRYAQTRVTKPLDSNNEPAICRVFALRNRCRLLLYNVIILHSSLKSFCRDLERSWPALSDGRFTSDKRIVSRATSTTTGVYGPRVRGEWWRCGDAPGELQL